MTGGPITCHGSQGCDLPVYTHKTGCQHAAVYLEVEIRKAGHLEHTAVVTAEEIREHFQGYLGLDCVVQVVGTATADTVKGMSYTERGLAHLDDPDVRVVREILHANQRAYPNDGSWGNMSYLKGSYDDSVSFQAALKRYKEIKS